MSSERHAILIGNGEFPREPGLGALRFPGADVEALRELLTAPPHGLFRAERVTVLQNGSSQEAREAVNVILNGAGSDALVVIYYSGHGKLNRAGKLHLATADTRLGALEATSVSVAALREFVDGSRARSVALILDCCYSGAARRGLERGVAGDEVFASLQGEAGGGTRLHLMTASNATQVAEERPEDRHGIFTKHLLEGIRHGGADRDGDGYVSLNELFDYVRDRVLKEGAQEPLGFNLGRGGDLVLAKSGERSRTERNRELQPRLLKLEEEGLLPESLIGKALRIMRLPTDRLSPAYRVQDELLDRLWRRQIDVGELVASWYAADEDSQQLRMPRMPYAPASTATATPAPAPATPARPADAGRDRWSAREAFGDVRDLVRGGVARSGGFSLLRSRPGLAALLGLVFVINFVETSLEEVIKTVWGGEGQLGAVMVELGEKLTRASHRIEGWLSFGAHDTAGMLTVYCYSIAYFFFFPALCLGVAIATWRRGLSPFRTFSLALVVDYALSLPFFLFFPVIERWAYPESRAILLSDLWFSQLIDAVRPISGLDNCFPSFHVSMTVVAIAVAFRFRLRLRAAVCGLGATVILSTFVLGIHWIADMVAGLTVGLASVAVAGLLDRRLGAGDEPAMRPVPETVIDDDDAPERPAGSATVFLRRVFGFDRERTPLRIFVSYRRQDSRHPAGRIDDQLAEVFGRANVFKDVHGIEPGEDWRRRLCQAVDGSDAAVVVIGPSWLTVEDELGRRRLDDAEDWVRYEIERAIECDLYLIPVLVDGAALPDATDLPEKLRPLVSRQAMRVGDAGDDTDFHHDLKRLVRALRRFALRRRFRGAA